MRGRERQPASKEPYERWGEAAFWVMPSDTRLAGQRLISQMSIDLHFRDERLEKIMGKTWWERMLRDGSREPDKAKRLWLYLVEHRRMPRR
ncbi:hypothetical protein R6258_07940 [Halomonas sp. HP20-15]|uniref:hypothetical protein n=1 Tax=Halomonas sp. HP20-15 TaxID=3085901 RepID=UPI002981A314|nr:hypothetical protein [Halomonas sp. HP20-15]MDW5376851.1 hypothetical protein [Halomonas sp. HP20-15]